MAVSSIYRRFPKEEGPGRTVSSVRGLPEEEGPSLRSTQNLLGREVRSFGLPKHSMSKS